MSIIVGESRDQMFFSSLNEMISTDNEVRLIDMIVELLVATLDQSKYMKGKDIMGRPAYSLCIMLKLFLYGYLNKIASSRRLEKECYRNIELRWLINNLAPDHKTIANFRKDNGTLIQDFSISFRVLLKQHKLISGELMAIDGTKLKANASSKSYSKEEIETDIESLRTDILRYLSTLDESDLQSGDLTLKEIEQQIDKQKKKIEKLEEMLELSSRHNKKKVSTIDPDSRAVKDRRSMQGYNGYNLQLIVDSLYKLISTTAIVQSANDLNAMEPTLLALKNELGIEPKMLLADTGYENVSVIQDIEQNSSIEVIVSVKENNQSDSEPTTISKDKFIYDEERDIAICPHGKVLEPKQKNKLIVNRRADVYQANPEDCTICPLRSQCTKSKKGRSITLYSDRLWVDVFQNKMKSKPVKKLLSRRRAIIEHVFGVIKCWMGKNPLLMRGEDHVKTEIELYATAFNLRRLLNIFGINKLKDILCG